MVQKAKQKLKGLVFISMFQRLKITWWIFKRITFIFRNKELDRKMPRIANEMFKPILLPNRHLNLKERRDQPQQTA